MSNPTKDEGLNKLRGRYARAGQEHQTKILAQVIDLFDYHAKRPSARCAAAPVRRKPRRSSGGH